MYIKHMAEDGRVSYENADGGHFGESPGNDDYDQMILDVKDDPSCMRVSNNIPKPSDVDQARMNAYGTWQEQLDMQYHGTWKAHVAKVKADNPK
jgi:hypothetical protein